MIIQSEDRVAGMSSFCQVIALLYSNCSPFTTSAFAQNPDFPLRFFDIQLHRTGNPNTNIPNIRQFNKFYSPQL